VNLLFLGSFAGSQAEIIGPMIESPMAKQTIADERDLARLVPALDAVDIVVTDLWRRGFSPAPSLRLVQAPVAGTDQIDRTALPSGVTICNAYGHEAAIAEYVIMAMLVWQHRYFEIAAGFRAGSWRDSGVTNGPLHREVAGRTLGIVGLGHIGRELAPRAAALGCRVVAANRTVREAPSCVERVYPLTALDEMLPHCDFVAQCLGLTPDTRGLLDAGRLARMKRDALLINVGRGAVVDEDALYVALRDRTIGGAALDVWYRYPAPDDAYTAPSRHPFHELPNVIMTPHCSAWTEEMTLRRGADTARNIDRFVRGEPLMNVVAVT
jgi:phosphoglycerate dehydrogenase-like enzyme